MALCELSFIIDVHVTTHILERRAPDPVLATQVRRPGTALDATTLQAPATIFPAQD